MVPPGRLSECLGVPVLNTLIGSVPGDSPQRCSLIGSPDHPPGGLHVPVHPLLRRADHGDMEAGAPPPTHPDLLAAAGGRGLLPR